MQAKTTILSFALPLALAIGVSAHAQQIVTKGGPANGVLTKFPTRLKTPAPRGCTQWVVDGENGLAILDKRAEYYRQQLLAYRSATPPAPKEKRLSREQLESVKAGESRVKAIEHELKCDAINRQAFRKENLGWDKAKEAEAGRARQEKAADVSFAEIEKTQREVLRMLQQIMEANAKTNRDIVNKL